MPEQFGISRIRGLSESQSAQRLAEEGPNELPGGASRRTVRDLLAKDSAAAVEHLRQALAALKAA